MPNYNKVKYIREAIQSVLNQSIKDWELIIVDDASSDDSVKEISKFLHDERIKFFQNEYNIGVEQTLVKAVNKSNSEWILILGSDDVLKVTCLEDMSSFIKEKPYFGLVYAQCLYCDQNLIPLHVGYSTKPKHDETNLHSVSVTAPKCFRKDIYLSASQYDMGVDRAEDLNFTLKAEEITSFYFLDSILHMHRILPNSLSHGIINSLKHKSSSALVKYWAYKRRLNTNISNLNKIEISEVLFWGIISSLITINFGRLFKFLKYFFKENPASLISLNFYILIFRRIQKVKNLN